MRKTKRIVKIATKQYRDTKTGLLIVELLSAADFGIAVWQVTDKHRRKDIFTSPFLRCKQWLYETFPDDKDLNTLTFAERTKYHIDI